MFHYDTVANKVNEFYKARGGLPDIRKSFLFIEEEYEELYSAFMDDNDDAAELKELADLVYVIYGYAKVRGWDLETAINRVHESNMTKFPAVIVDGKVTKGPNYQKPDLSDLV